MNRLCIHLALRDQDFEEKISAAARAAGHRTRSVHLDAVLNNCRVHDTLFVVEEEYHAILDLIEFQNSCLFNFLPTIIVTTPPSAIDARLSTVRFPYKYLPLERALLPALLSRVARLLDQLRRSRSQETLLRLHAAVVAPFSAPGATFGGALGPALRAMLDLLFAQKGSLMLVNRWGNLIVEAATNRAIEGIEVPYDHASPAWSVMENGEPLFCEDILKYPRFKKKIDAYAKDHFLIVPVKLHGKSVGVLNLSDKTVSLLFDRADLLRAQGLLHLLEPILAARCGALAVR